MVVIDNMSGRTVALLGGAGKKEADRILDYTNVPVPPASSLKPIALYADLVDSGEVNPATMFDDVPIYYKETENGISGYPKNSPNVYDGQVCLADAIAFSKNTVAITAYRILGADRIVKSLGEKYGIEGLGNSDYYESPLALGQLTDGITLRQLTRAYSAFAREGVISFTKYYDTVYNKDGDVLLVSISNEKRIMSREGAQMMNQLL